MDGMQRLLIVLVVGVAAGETEPLCLWIMALTAISCMAQVWWEEHSAAAVSAITLYNQQNVLFRERGGVGDKVIYL